MRIAIVLLLVLAGFARAEIVPMTVAPGFVELAAGKVDPEADVSWEPRQPFDLPYREYISVRDGQRVCVLHLQPGKYVMLCDVIDWAAKKRSKRTFVITVEGDAPPDPRPPPGPPPGPNPPPLSGLAAQVYRSAKNVALPKEKAAAFALNFESVASAIAAGGVKSIKDAQQMLRDLNDRVKAPRSSAPLWNAIDKYLEEQVRSDVKKAEAAFTEIAKGLKAI